MSKRIRVKTPNKLQTPQGRRYLIVGLTIILGIFLSLAIKQNDEPKLLSSAREDELVRILDDLSKQKDNLELELIKQSQVLDSLKSGSNEEAKKAAQNRIDQLILLSGTAPVTGRGIQVLITGDVYSVSAYTVLDSVQELRDAGAVAIEINGNRIINSTYFNDTSDGITINQAKIRSPYRINALGDPETLATALKIPGGLAEKVTTSGGQVVITQYATLVIESTVDLITPQYAVPVTK
ncbi:MAG: DUF881 domain-containing protein [Candidatus Nanopelagicales bacterium]|nr:DUF881 domain-containing protein [Candidatus Nanopelagicales bacterium]